MEIDKVVQIKFGSSDIENLKKKYSRQSDRFKKAREFVLRKTTLPEEVKEIMMIFEGSPIQGLFYNTVIFNMADTTYETIVSTGAELYHLQRELNRRIGRTLNGKDKIDRTLIGHIYNEMVYRFPDIQDIALDTNLENDIFKRFLSNDALHKKEITSATDLKTALLIGFGNKDIITKEELAQFLSESVKPANTNDSDRSFYDYFKKCEERNSEIYGNKRKSSICNKNTFVVQTEISFSGWYDKKLPRDLDELFIVCISMGISYSDFSILRELAAREGKNSVKYASNIYTDRDEKIECYIRDIDAIYQKYENLYIAERPKKILEDIDNILKDNDFPLLVKPRLHKKVKKY